MTATSILVDALTDEPTSTSDLYDRIGYPALVRAGLVPYPAFREALVRLSAAGLALSGTDEDGATTWRRPAPADAEGGGEAGDAGERTAGGPTPGGRAGSPR